MSVEMSFMIGPYRLATQVGRSPSGPRVRARPALLLPAPRAMLEDRR